MDKPVPCPFCGSNRVMNCDDHMLNGDGSYVFCMDCNARGPSREASIHDKGFDDSLDYTAWNKRSKEGA